MDELTFSPTISHTQFQWVDDLIEFKSELQKILSKAGFTVKSLCGFWGPKSHGIGDF